MNLTLRQNMTNMAMSQYMNFFFDRGIRKIGGKIVALNCNELCFLEGHSNNDSPMVSLVATGYLKLNHSRLRSLYIYGKPQDADSFIVDYGMSGSEIEEETLLASTSRIRTSGDGVLKFGGRRDVFGTFLMVRIRNDAGKSFLISSVDGVIVRGTRR